MDYTSACENKLIELYYQGDSRGIDELVRRYQPRLFGYLRRFEQDKHTIEDLIQQTWIRATMSPARFDPARGTPFHAWLFTIARNLWRDHTRSRHSPLSASDLDVSAVADPLDQLEDDSSSGEYSKDDLEQLSHCLKKLEPNLRRAVEIKFNLVEGQPANQAEELAKRQLQGLANELNVSPAAVSRWVREALDQLRVCMQQAAQKTPSNPS